MSQYALAIESLFRIYNKKGELINFTLNSLQNRIDAELETSKRISVLKYRQGGVSTYVMARFLVKCMAEHTIAVMLAHDKEHTVKLLERAQLVLKHLRHDLTADTSKMNEGEILFKKTDSSFYIGTAGSRDFGRSATITDLHLSEIAFYKDPKRLLVGLLQSVPKETGTVIQETTANGWGTWFQKRFYSYIEGKGGFKACFYPWWIHEEYRATSEAAPPYQDFSIDYNDPRYREDWEKTEQYLINNFSCDLYQIQWRREKIEEFDGDVEAFMQEYPATVKEAFRLSGGSLFSFIHRPEEPERLPNWNKFERDGWILSGHPKKGFHYALGADAAGGTGGDNSAIEIGCLNTMEQVFEWKNSNISPPEFGQVIARFGKMFNTAYLVPEANSHGLSVLYVLKQLYSRQQLYKYMLTKRESAASINIPSYGYGWKTSEVSKPYAVGIAQKLLKAGFKLYSLSLADELLSFTETDSGKLEGIGEHDDSAMAFLLMCIGLLKISRKYGIELTVYDEDAEREELDESLLGEQIEHLRTEASDKQVYDSDGKYIMPITELWGKPKHHKKGALGALLCQ